MNPEVKDGYPCPIPGCKFRALKLDGLFAHLTLKHSKAELIKWIIAEVRKRVEG